MPITTTITISVWCQTRFGSNTFVKADLGIQDEFLLTHVGYLDPNAGHRDVSFNKLTSEDRELILEELIAEWNKYNFPIRQPMLVVR